MGKKNKSAKRKAKDSEVATEVLSHKSLGDKEEVVAEDDLGEPTMGEKLASLNLEGNERAPDHDDKDTSVLAKLPSADSVYILLKQALRADDRALLIDCLYRQDEKVITNSLSLLNPSDVLKFLHSLISIIQLRGAVLACALSWLRNLLLQHAGSIMSQESSLAALNTLYQRGVLFYNPNYKGCIVIRLNLMGVELIESRVSTFNNALQLSSCLDLLYAETIHDGVEETDTVAPVIYEDEDESDDEGSVDSMEVETVEDGDEPKPCSDISDDEVNG